VLLGKEHFSSFAYLIVICSFEPCCQIQNAVLVLWSMLVVWHIELSPVVVSSDNEYGLWSVA